jgi:hypothetical protein
VKRSPLGERPVRGRFSSLLSVTLVR